MALISFIVASLAIIGGLGYCYYKRTGVGKLVDVFGGTSHSTPHLTRASYTGDTPEVSDEESEGDWVRVRKPSLRRSDSKTSNCSRKSVRMPSKADPALDPGQLVKSLANVSTGDLKAALGGTSMNMKRISRASSRTSLSAKDPPPTIPTSGEDLKTLGHQSGKLTMDPKELSQFVSYLSKRQGK